MQKNKIFIAWNKENLLVAQKIQQSLTAKGYSSIIGGNSRNSFTISTEIINQMDQCDYGIFLIEKERRTDENSGDVVSYGFNPNVMLELGYMLNKVTNPNNIRRLLINLNPSEMPSDLLGAWSEKIKKRSFNEADEADRDAALQEVADAAVKDFIEYIESNPINPNKLDYFNKWDEYAVDIFNFTRNSRISEKLLYGMQAALYAGNFVRLYEQLKNIRKTLSEDNGVIAREEQLYVVSCAMAILNVFVLTERLTKPLTKDAFSTLYFDLNKPYEQHIEDKDLSAWCGIFRNDKIELCIECYAATAPDAEKITLYKNALSLCHRIISMIEAQIEANPNDASFALIYYAFTSRNIAQIHKFLAELEPDKADEYVALQKEYCKKTLDYRRDLYDLYITSDSLSKGYVEQEYLLSLAEQYDFEEDFFTKMNIKITADTLYKELLHKNRTRNMIFNKVTEIAKDFLDVTD